MSQSKRRRRGVVFALVVAAAVVIGDAWRRRELRSSDAAPCGAADGPSPGVATSDGSNRSVDASHDSTPPVVEATRTEEPTWELRGKVVTESDRPPGVGSVELIDEHGRRTTADVDDRGAFEATLRFVKLSVAKLATNDGAKFVEVEKEKLPELPPPTAPLAKWEWRVPDFWRVTGRVVDVGSGEPVEDVRVDVQYVDRSGARKRLTSKSDHDGFVRFDAVGMTRGELLTYPKLGGEPIDGAEGMDPEEVLRRATSTRDEERAGSASGKNGFVSRFDFSRFNAATDLRDRIAWEWRRAGDDQDRWPVDARRSVKMQDGSPMDVGVLGIGAPGRLVFVAPDAVDRPFSVLLHCPVRAAFVVTSRANGGRTSVRFPPGHHVLDAMSENVWRSVLRFPKAVDVRPGVDVEVPLELVEWQAREVDESAVALVIRSWNRTPIEGARVEAGDGTGVTGRSGLASLGVPRVEPGTKFFVTLPSPLDRLEVVTESQPIEPGDDPNKSFVLAVPPRTFVKLHVVDSNGDPVRAVHHTIFTRSRGPFDAWERKLQHHDYGDCWSESADGHHRVPFSRDADAETAFLVAADLFGAVPAWIPDGRLDSSADEIEVRLEDRCERLLRVVDVKDVGLDDVEVWTTPIGAPRELFGGAKTGFDGWARIHPPRRHAVVTVQRKDGWLTQLFEYENVEQLPAVLTLR